MHHYFDNNSNPTQHYIEICDAIASSIYGQSNESSITYRHFKYCKLFEPFYDAINLREYYHFRANLFKTASKKILFDAIPFIYSYEKMILDNF